MLLALGTTAALSAQTRVTLPTGAVFLVRTGQALESASAQVGQNFETTVVEDVSVNGYTVIPADSRIRGVVAYVQRADRQRSGVMQVTFDRLTLPDGSGYAIAGKLTSTDSTERRQIDARADSRVVLVGERGGLGATIAGAGSTNSATSGILATLANMLSEGLDVNVPAGSAVAVQLERSLTLSVRGVADLTDESTIFTAADRVRAAQQALARRSYYRGTVNGQLDNATRSALFEFQLDNNINATGNLDGRTATALGILAGGTGGAVLSANDAALVRRAAQALVTRTRRDLGISASGVLNPNRSLADGDLDLLFALSAFADNASLYQQLIGAAGNSDSDVQAGRALLNGARRVDAAMQQTRPSASVRNVWNSVRQQLAGLDANYR